MYTKVGQPHRQTTGTTKTSATFALHSLSTPLAGSSHVVVAAIQNIEVTAQTAGEEEAAWPTNRNTACILFAREREKRGVGEGERARE